MILVLKPPQHVAVVVPSLTRAGAERVAETLAREFVTSCRTTVVTMEPRLAVRELGGLLALPWSERIPAGCHHVHLPAPGSGLVRFLPLVVRVALLARRERFDAVYSFLTWTNVLVACARMFGGRYVHIATEHAMAETSLKGRGRFSARAGVLALLYRRPDWIVVVSDAARRSLADAGLLPRPDRALTIPNPIDRDQIRRLASATKPSGPSADDIVLVCVGRLHEHKDHQTLLRALARLPVRYRLVIVGDGPLRSELSRCVAELGLDGRVTFTGALANPYPVMAGADVVVLPSRQEGFGLVAAEAAALDVPFVGSAVGGLADLCTLLGYPTFPLGDDEKLAAAITALGDRPSIDGRAGDVVKRLFAPAEIAARYLRLAYTK